MPVKSPIFCYFSMISLLWSQNINDFGQKMPRRRGSAEYPFAVRSVFAFGHRCSLLCDEPTTTSSRKFILRMVINLIKRHLKNRNSSVTGRSGHCLHGGTPLLVESCVHTYLDCNPIFCARRVASCSRLALRLEFFLTCFTSNLKHPGLACSRE